MYLVGSLHGFGLIGGIFRVPFDSLLLLSILICGCKCGAKVVSSLFVKGAFSPFFTRSIKEASVLDIVETKFDEGRIRDGFITLSGKVISCNKLFEK